jgi:hypothetical protein
MCSFLFHKCDDGACCCLILQIAGENIVFSANEENHSKLQALDEALHPEEGLKIAARLLATK